MGNIQFSGLATGIDTASLIKALVEAKRQPIKILQKQADVFQGRITRLDEFAAKISALRSAVAAISATTSFAAYMGATSNKDILTVTASSAASEGNHTVSITQLAKNQTTLGTPSTTITSTTAAAGISGTLSLTPSGGPTNTVTVASTDTLEGIRDAINNSVVKAFGTLTFASVPVNATTVTVDGKTYEFTTGTPSGSNIKVDTTGLTTAAQAASALASAATGGNKGANSTMTASGATVTVVADTAGAAGNAIAMTESGDSGNAVLLSGATLSGGGAPSYSASILNSGTSSNPSYSLVLTGKNGGTANAFTATGLSGITFSNSANAQDAIFSVDGITGIHRNSNVVTDVIVGVTLSLVDAPAGSPSVSVSITKDTASVKTKIKAFISAYNDLKSYVNANTKFDLVTKTGGPLMGESAVSTVSRGLADLIVNSVSGLTGSFTALSQTGVKTQTDGTLTLDETKLDGAMGSDFQGVINLFAKNYSTGTEGVAYKIQAKIDQWMSSVDGVITTRKSGIQTSVRRLNEQIEQKESAVALYEKSLKLQYSRLEQLVSNLKDQSGALNSIGARLY
ncbi:MAG: flagellar filament capping protein FliD [Deltaproteobacteria bacterium]|nr:flagellar filament capping protein FliD [Deltaproteobacteria bacterium]